MFMTSFKQLLLSLFVVLLAVPALTAKPPKSTQDSPPHVPNKVTEVLESYDVGNDGSLDRAEIVAMARGNPDLAQKAKPFDVDHDGTLSRTEMCAWFNAVALENKMATKTAKATPGTAMVRGKSK
jgi:hypothetical protein